MNTQATFLAASIQQPLIIVNTELRCLAANAAFCGWFGGKPDLHVGVELQYLANGAFAAPDVLAGLRAALSEKSPRGGLSVPARDTELELQVCPCTLNGDSALIIVFERQAPTSLPTISPADEIEALWALLAGGPYVLFETDGKGVLHRISAGFERLTGWSPDYWLGKSTQSLVHPDDIARFIAPNIELDGVWLHAVRLLTKSGDYRRFEVCTYPLLGPDGNVRRVFGICRDMTEYFVLLDRRKDAESEARALFAAMDDVVAVLARDGHVERVLSIPEGILPWRADEIERLSGATVDELLSPLVAAESIARIEAALRAGKPLRHEFMYEIDGERHYFSAVYSPLDDDRVLAVAHDITERVALEEAVRISDERFRQLVENIDVVFWSGPPDGSLDYISPAFERVAGISPESYAADRSLLMQMTHPDDRERVTETLSQVLERSSLTLEFRWIRPDGDVRNLLARAFVTVDEHGQPQYISGITEDVTDRRKAEKQAQALALTEERAGVLEQLITEVSHDLRNPVTVLRSSAFLLERHLHQLREQLNELYEHVVAGRSGSVRTQALSLVQMTADMSEQVGRVGSSIQRIQSSVEARLYEVRAERGVGFEFSAQSLGALIRQTSTARRADAARRGLNIKLDLDDALPHVVLDAAEFVRALRILIDRALQDAPDHASVTILTRMEDSLALIEVFGPVGVDQEELARLVDPAYRAAQLGDQWQLSHDLAIAQRIVLAHGGKVGQQIRPGGVRVWRVWLPVARTPANGGDVQALGS